MVGIIVALVLVAAGAVVGYMMLSNDGFSVGDCVRQDGDSAVSASCDEEGAFRIVEEVDDHQDCPNPEEAYIEQGSGDDTQILCLEPAAGSAE